MKKLTYNLTVLLFLFGILFGCARNTKNVGVEADIAAINEFYDKYMHYAQTGDIDNFITLWADDAKRSEPGIPTVVGKENIRANFKSKFDAFNHKITPYGEVELEVCKDMAFGYSTATLSSTPKEGGPPQHIDLKVLTIFKRQDDGSWKIYIDCVNFHPTLSKDSIPSEYMEEEYKPY